MSKVIFIGSDRKIFDSDSSVRKRMIEYGSLFEELHIVLFTRRGAFGTKDFKLSQNVFLHPTHSLTRWFYPFSGAKIVKKIIKKSGDKNWIISAQDPFEAGLGALWGMVQGRSKMHIQIHVDFLSPFFKKQSLLNRLRVFISKFVLSKADGVRIVSERILNSLNKKGFKLKCVPYLLPIWHEFDYNDVKAFNFKKIHPNWSFVIICMSRLEPEKNINLSLRVFKKILVKYPDTGLVILGSGKEEKKSKLLAKFLGIDQNVDFLGWQNNTKPYLLGSNLFLQTSNFEGFGVSSIEASYANLPVVSTDVGSSGWIFKDGVSAMICEVGDEECLHKKIIEIMENNDVRQKLIYGAKMAISHNLPQNKADYLQKFKESLEKFSSL